VATAAEILGVVKTEFLAEIAEAVIGHDASKSLSLFGDFVKSGGDSQELAEALTGYIRTLMLIKNGVEDVAVLEVDKNEIERARDLLGDIESVDLLRFFTVLADYKQAVKSGQDPRFAFEAVLVKLSSMDRAVTLEKLFKNQGSDSGNISSPPAPGRKISNGQDSGANFRFSDHRLKDNAPAADSMPIVNRTNTITPLSYEGELSIKVISENWDNFCGFVSQEDKTIFAHLSLSMPSLFENGRLTIGVDDKHNFQFEQLNRINTRKMLEKSLKKYFSNEIKLNIIQGPDQGRKSDDLPGNLNPDKLFKGAPTAKKLFDLMDGEFLTQ
jgi:DNA polymerase III gamma/tau subunit